MNTGELQFEDSREAVDTSLGEGDDAELSSQSHIRRANDVQVIRDFQKHLPKKAGTERSLFEN
jgi:hypothetical protein